MTGLLRLSDLLRSITQLTVHAVPNRRGERDLTIGHIGERTDLGNQKERSQLKVRYSEKTRKTSQGGKKGTGLLMALCRRMCWESLSG